MVLGEFKKHLQTIRMMLARELHLKVLLKAARIRTFRKRRKTRGNESRRRYECVIALPSPLLRPPFVGFHLELIYLATRTSMMIQLRLPVPVLMLFFCADNEGLIYGTRTAAEWRCQRKFLLLEYDKMLELWKQKTRRCILIGSLNKAKLHIELIVPTPLER
jgi:hypothetical protein